MKKFVKLIINNLKEDYVSEYSAQCAYFAILSFIPFIIVMFSLVQYVGIEKQTFVDILNGVIPKNMNDIIIKIVEEIYSKSTGRLSISIVFTLWSAGKVIYALSKGFKTIFKVEEKNYFYLRFGAIVQTIVLIVLIVSFISIFGKSEKWSIVVLIFLVLFILYRVMSENKVLLKNQILGALISSIILASLSIIFSVYLELFKNFSIIYGSLTSFILIMMWIYSVFYVIFLGAEIVKLL